MKKIIFLFLLLFSTISMSALSSYSVGSNADFYVYTFDGQYYLILSFKDDNENKLVNNTIVKFLLNDGTVMRLEGTQSNAKNESSYVHIDWYTASGSSSETHFAVLKITKEQIESLKKGVSKVAINTLPKVYKRNKWSGKDKFGLSLYAAFAGLRGELED